MNTRKPAIYLLVNLPIVVGGGIFFVAKIMSCYAASKGIPLAEIPDSAGLLIALPSLFLWLPLALLISNTAVVLVPPLRKIAESYTKQSGHPGFGKSQIQLVLALLALSIICVPIIMYGFMR